MLGKCIVEKISCIRKLYNNLGVVLHSLTHAGLVPVEQYT